MDATITLAMREQDWNASRAAFESQIANLQNQLQKSASQPQHDDSALQTELREAQVKIKLLTESNQEAEGRLDAEKQATIAVREELVKVRSQLVNVSELQEALQHSQMLKADLEPRLSEAQKQMGSMVVPVASDELRQENEKLQLKVSEMIEII